MDENLLKQKIQRWIVTVSVLILVGKFIAFYITNSVGILTDAMESIVNVVAGFISLYSIHWASRPKKIKNILLDTERWSLFLRLLKVCLFSLRED